MTASGSAGPEAQEVQRQAGERRHAAGAVSGVRSPRSQGSAGRTSR